MESSIFRLLLAAGAFLIVGCARPRKAIPRRPTGCCWLRIRASTRWGLSTRWRASKSPRWMKAASPATKWRLRPTAGCAFVPIYGNSGVGSPGTDGRTVAVIDIATRKLVDTIDLGKPLRPHCAVFGPQNGLLYVTTELGDSVTIIDPESLHILGSVPTGQPESHMLAITHDGKRGYTSNVHVGTVSVLDLEARQNIAVIHVRSYAQRIALSVDDRWVFTADQTQPQLAVIDTSTNEVAKWIPLEGHAYGTAATLDGKWLLVTLPDLGKVAVVDLSSMSVVRIGERAQGAAGNPGAARQSGGVRFLRRQQEGGGNQSANVEGGPTD